MKRREFFKSALLAGAATALPWSRAGAAAGDAATTVATGTSDIAAVKLSGEATTIPGAAVRALADNLHGTLLTAADKDYEQARRLWNKMINRRPALIARCSGAADVAHAVSFARERDLLVAVRGGGHSFPGFSSCNGGIVIDLSGMRGVRVDPAQKTARVAGGAWIGDLDWEAQQYGLAVTMGAISNTGVGGLTLGGGYGWLGRRYGLSCDNLIGADLVTAEGKLLHVSAEENPDLFWALRGGGGNFGVVTSFEYRLHAVGPKVLAGILTYEPAQAREVLDYYAQFAPKAPRECSVAPAYDSGEVALAVCYNGDLKQGEKVLQPLRTFIKAKKDDVRAMDYVQVQRQFDGPPLSTMNSYLKGGFVAELTPALIGVLADMARQGGLMGWDIDHCAGAIADVSPTATAIAHRRELYMLLAAASWPNDADNEQNRAQLHAAWDKIKPHTSGFYVNLNDPDQKAVDENYGPNRARLAAIKKTYDPGNLFRLNANVKPAA